MKLTLEVILLKSFEIRYFKAFDGILNCVKITRNLRTNETFLTKKLFMKMLDFKDWVELNTIGGLIGRRNCNGGYLSVEMRGTSFHYFYVNSIVSEIPLNDTSKASEKVLKASGVLSL